MLFFSFPTRGELLQKASVPPEMVHLELVSEIRQVVFFFLFVCCFFFLSVHRCFALAWWSPWSVTGWYGAVMKSLMLFCTLMNYVRQVSNCHWQSKLNWILCDPFPGYLYLFRRLLKNGSFRLGGDVNKLLAINHVADDKADCGLALAYTSNQSFKN